MLNEFHWDSEVCVFILCFFCRGVLISGSAALAGVHPSCSPRVPVQELLSVEVLPWDLGYVRQLSLLRWMCGLQDEK